MRSYTAAMPQLLAVVLLLLGGSVPLQAATDTLRIGGTGAALGVMNRLAAAYRSETAGAEIEVLPSLGSSGSLRALAEGAIDIAVSARALKPKEAEAGLRAAPLSRTPFVMVTSRQDAQPLAAAALAGLYADPKATWSDGTPLRVILRPQSDSDSAFLERHFDGMAKALAKARQRAEVPMAKTDQENIRLATRIDGSLTTATLTQVVSENAAVTVLTLDGVAPTLENLESGRYPFFKELVIARRVDAGPSVLAFLAFVDSPQGRQILRDSGNLPPR
ncbi:MAG: hypothetical protein Tsb0032_17390 [Kiloniellaceae bacterium]